jgi:hypothetical protein
LALNSFSGDITGTPGAVAVTRFTVYVTDRRHASASRSFQIPVT